MKTIAPLLLILIVATQIVCAQKLNNDSLLSLLSNAKEDTAKVNLLYHLSSNYFNSDPDSMLGFGQDGLILARAIGYKKKEMDLQQRLSQYWWSVGDYAMAIKLQLPLLEYVTAQRDTPRLALILSSLLRSYRDQGDYQEALRFGFAAKVVYMKSRDCAWCGIANADIGSVHYEMNTFDSALFYLKLAEAYPSDSFHDGWVLLMTGRTYAKMNRNDLAFAYYHQSFKKLTEGNNLKDLAGAYTSIAAAFQKAGQADSAIYYGKEALRLAQQKKFNKEVFHSYFFLATAYEKTDPENAVAYYKLAIAAKDRLYNQEKQRQIISYKFNEELQQREAIAQQARFRNKLHLNAIMGITFTLLVIALLLWRNNWHRQKAFALLQKQKAETDHQRTKAEEALSELKSTQAQLIQKEKMASLGELTAGIAHEIQNPLNFVNNFSETNTELLAELKQELLDKNYEQAHTLVNDVENNQYKITHHGKRADSIVKGMLQHARTSKGEKQPTNINGLTDEYLRLSYQGQRAKDKEFTATIKTSFDEASGTANVVPQEIGRVLLNLFNNAFYAVSEKARQLNGTYEPTVSVTTKKERDHLTITVEDNGVGMAPKVAEKVFQPFFTTKPAGEGTGLGLSLSYDIINKGHGGSFSVQSTEGEGSKFVIQLPIS